MKMMKMLSLGCVGALALAAAAAYPPPSPAGGASGGDYQDDTPKVEKAKVGEKAPSFTLPDTDGKLRSLSDYKGKIVVVEWINPRCPVCDRVYRSGIIKDMIEDLQKLDEELVYLTINSSADAPEDKVIKESAFLLEDNEIEDVPALIDYDGKVGTMYDARTTPHLYVIDTEGVLRYQGAIDDDRNGAKGRRGEPVMNYPINAVTQIKAGETVSPDETTPYGCTVKYSN